MGATRGRTFQEPAPAVLQPRTQIAVQALDPDRVVTEDQRSLAVAVGPLRVIQPRVQLESVHALQSVSGMRRGRRAGVPCLLPGERPSQIVTERRLPNNCTSWNA